MDLHDTGATFMPLEAGHRLGPRNSTRFDEGTVENPSKIETPSDEGKEKHASDRFCGNVQEITNLEMAERVGVLARDLAKANVYSSFRLISRNRSDLAASGIVLCFRPFAGFCRFFYFNGTRNGTRRDRLPRRFPRVLANITPCDGSARGLGAFLMCDLPSFRTTP